MICGMKWNWLTSYQSRVITHKSQSVLSHHIYFFPTKTMMAEILNSRLLKYGRNYSYTLCGVAGICLCMFLLRAHYSISIR